MLKNLADSELVNISRECQCKTRSLRSSRIINIIKVSSAFLTMGVLFPLLASADHGFEVLTQQGYTVKAGSQITIDNMPRIRSQGTAGVCYAFAASTLLDYRRCVERNIADCQALPDQERTSPIDLVRYKRVLPDDVDWSDRFNYEGIDLDEGGDPAYTLSRALAVGGFVTEACAPYDRFLSNLDNLAEQQKADFRVWAQLRQAFEKNKKNPRELCKEEKKALEEFQAIRNARGYADTESGENEKNLDYKKEKGLKESFEGCAGTILLKYVRGISVLKVPPVEAYAAFAEKTYPGFLDRMLVPEKCWDMKNQVAFKKRPNFDFFPGYIDNDVKKPVATSEKKMAEKIQGLLSQKVPIAMALCLSDKLPPKSKQCRMGHTVVLSGSRTVCKGSTCKISYRVHNSWGQAWQDQNDHGWVDGEELIRRTRFDPQSLTYLEPKN